MISIGYIKAFLLLVGATFVGQLGLAQEIRFSQNQAVPLYINPASAGRVSNPLIRLHSRLQQFGPVAYRTGFASIALPVFLSNQEAASGGIGINFLQDVAGQSQEYRTTEAQLAAAYNIFLDRYATQWISLGLQTGFSQTRVDFSQLQWPSQLRYNGFTGGNIPYENFGDQQNLLGINAGISWFYDPTRNPLSETTPCRLYAGFALHNLNEPSLGFVSTSDNRLQMGYTAQAGGEFLLSDRVSVTPDILAFWQNPFFTYQVSTYFTYYTQVSTPSNPVPSSFKLLAGTGYREENVLIFLLGLGGEKWQTSVSYDANLAIERRGVPNQYALEFSILYQWFPRNAPKTQSTPLF